MLKMSHNVNTELFIWQTCHEGRVCNVYLWPRCDDASPCCGVGPTRSPREQHSSWPNCRHWRNEKIRWGNLYAVHFYLLTFLSSLSSFTVCKFFRSLYNFSILRLLHMPFVVILANQAFLGSFLRVLKIFTRKACKKYRWMNGLWIGLVRGCARWALCTTTPTNCPGIPILLPNLHNYGRCIIDTVPYKVIPWGIV